MHRLLRGLRRTSWTVGSWRSGRTCGRTRRRRCASPGSTYPCSAGGRISQGKQDGQPIRKAIAMATTRRIGLPGSSSSALAGVRGKTSVRDCWSWSAHASRHRKIAGWRGSERSRLGPRSMEPLRAHGHRKSLSIVRSWEKAPTNRAVAARRQRSRSSRWRGFAIWRRRGCRLLKINAWSESGPWHGNARTTLVRQTSSSSSRSSSRSSMCCLRTSRPAIAGKGLGSGRVQRNRPDGSRNWSVRGFRPPRTGGSQRSVRSSGSGKRSAEIAQQ
mmetsp:Transcript_133712/g.387112  ORF Transcript_133712/g.387112 Transcript_133712/m.387112 type:complete len:273 (-) Transcript_133712:1804-2622(-)